MVESPASSSMRSVAWSSSRPRAPRGSGSSSHGARPGGREDPLRSPWRRRVPRVDRPAAAVLSGDGALTTTLVGILAEREIQPTPLEATTFALGIHEDTGSLRMRRARSATQTRSAGACATERARISSRRTCTRRCQQASATSSTTCSRGSSRSAPAGRSFCSQPFGGRSTWTGSRTSRTRSSTSPTRRRSCSSSKWRSECSRSYVAAAISWTPPPWRRPSVAEGTHRPPRPSFARISTKRAGW